MTKWKTILSFEDPEWYVGQRVVLKSGYIGLYSGASNLSLKPGDTGTVVDTSRPKLFSEEDNFVGVVWDKDDAGIKRWIYIYKIVAL